jgi:hypothetical protein
MPANVYQLDMFLKKKNLAAFKLPGLYHSGLLTCYVQAYFQQPQLFFSF